MIDEVVVAPVLLALAPRARGVGDRHGDGATLVVLQAARQRGLARAGRRRQHQHESPSGDALHLPSLDVLNLLAQLIDDGLEL